MNSCSVYGCEKKIKGRGYCSAHYRRWSIYGDPSIILRAETGEPERFLRKVALKHEGDDCLLWPYSIGSHGYGTISGYSSTVTAVICEEVNGKPVGNKYQAAHSCGNRRCCNPRHLQWKTPVENASDKVIHGTDWRGEKCKTRKLSAVEVRNIRSLSTQMMQKDIAKKYGVSRTIISQIIGGQRWSSL